MIRTTIYAGALAVLIVTPIYGIDIYEAIDSGYVDQVTNILKENPEIINSRNNDGMTPLIRAAYRGNSEIVRRLLNSGADITAGDNDNSGPIHNAAVAGNNEIIGILLEHGADINAVDNNGITPLLFALSYRNVNTANFLLDKNASARAISNRGLSALYYAVNAGQVELIKRLVESGADVDARAFDGQTVLHQAIWRNQIGAAEQLLLSGASIDIKEDYGRTPLSLTARETGSVDMARILIEHGADINTVDYSGDTPLVLAAWKGFSAVVNLLLDYNADVPITGENGEELLSYAAGKGLDRLFNMMSSKGADLSIKNRMGSGMLHAAASGGSTEIIKVLLGRGFSINEADLFGWTALHYAVDKGRFEAAELLMEKGADINVRTRCGKSAYNLADEKNRGEIKQLLLAHRANTGPQQFPDLAGPYMGQIPPGDTPQLFAPDIVSTNRNQHSAISFSPDGNQAFWNSNFMRSDSGYAEGALLYSNLTNGRWTSPEFPSFTIAFETDDDVPFFSPDGGRLYFISRRPLQPGHPGGKENIWFVENNGSGWGEPRPLPGALNNMQMHWQFSVTGSGTIYFTGEDPSGYGMGDIYKSDYVNGEYTAPQILGPVINTPGAEMSPFIAPDESYLLFAALRPDANNNGKITNFIYLSIKTADNQWAEPASTGIKGLCPVISPDGKYLFYRGSYGGQTGILWLKADFLWRLKPSNSG